MDVHGNQGEDEQCQAFVVYFKRTWVGRSARLKPRFDLEMCNNRHITMDALPKTTNSAENWHNQFAQLFNRHHPNPYKLLDALLSEQVRVDAFCVRINAGEVFPLFSRPEYRQTNERLLRILNNYQAAQAIQSDI